MGGWFVENINKSTLPGNFAELSNQEKIDILNKSWSIKTKSGIAMLAYHFVYTIK